MVLGTLCEVRFLFLITFYNADNETRLQDCVEATPEADDDLDFNSIEVLFQKFLVLQITDFKVFQEDLKLYGRDELILAALAAAGGTATPVDGDESTVAPGVGGGLCWRVQGHAQKIEADLRRVRSSLR